MVYLCTWRNVVNGKSVYWSNSVEQRPAQELANRLTAAKHAMRLPGFEEEEIVLVSVMPLPDDAELIAGLTSLLEG